MCDKCDELDKKIEHYRRIRSSIGDQITIERIEALIGDLQAQKATLHPEQKIGRDRSGRWLGQGLRFRRGYRAPKLWSSTVTSPQLSALDPADEFASHRFVFRQVHTPKVSLRPTNAPTISETQAMPNPKRIML
jgi:hypothetical protein